MPWGPRGKGSPSVSKGPKPPIQLLQLLKNRPREVKRDHFRYTGWAEKNVPNFKAILLLNCTAEKVQIWMV